jgi:hypothetical protein
MPFALPPCFSSLRVAAFGAVLVASACTGEVVTSGNTSPTTSSSTATGGAPGSTGTSSASGSTGTSSGSSSTSTGSASSSTGSGSASSSGTVTPACDPSAVADAPYTDEAQFDQAAVGRWARCSGPPQLPNETVGVEFTASHEIFALVLAGDGSVVRAPPTAEGVESWVVAFNVDPNIPVELTFSWANDPPDATLSIDGPKFFDGGQQMFLNYEPAPATYRRLP